MNFKCPFDTKRYIHNTATQPFFNWTTSVKTLWMYRVKQIGQEKRIVPITGNLTQCPIAIKKKGPFSVYSSLFSWYFIPLDRKKKFRLL